MTRSYLTVNGERVSEEEYIEYLRNCAESWEKGSDRVTPPAKPVPGMASLIRRKIEDIRAAAK